jgi:hypothetical protein
MFDLVSSFTAFVALLMRAHLTPQPASINTSLSPVLTRMVSARVPHSVWIELRVDLVGL